MKKTIITLLAFCAIVVVRAQNPVKWSFTARKTTGAAYEVRMTAQIQAGWSIYSQRTPEGGPVPTSFGFGKNPMMTLEGNVREEGKLQQKHEMLFGVDVLYYKDKVTFVQTIVLKKKVRTSLAGWVEFMVCDDTRCLPPKKQTFTLTLN